MTSSAHDFPLAGELPIPEDIQVDAKWPAQLVEMADHIGPYRTLLMAAHFGGQRLYIPADPTKGPIRTAIGEDGARILSDIYRREYLTIPTAKATLARARRAPIIAAVRARDISGNKATELLRTSRSYVSHLVNQTDEGEPAARLGDRRRLPGQMDLFGED